LFNGDCPPRNVLGEYYINYAKIIKRSSGSDVDNGWGLVCGSNVGPVSSGDPYIAGVSFLFDNNPNYPGFIGITMNGTPYVKSRWGWKRILTE